MKDICVIFLDFDGVINTIQYDEHKKRLRYFFERDGKVNNRTAVEFVNMIGEKFDAKVVVSSTWRMSGLDKMKQILGNSGLRLDVIDITPRIPDAKRGIEIQKWLDNHKEVNNFIIIDDDSDMVHLIHRLVKCNPYDGFTLDRYNEAIKLFEN